MSSPIGTIEFLVKFDTMQDSFVDTLKNAINKSDLISEGMGAGLPEDIIRDIKSIRLSIATRLRTPFTGEYEQAVAVAKPEIGWTQKKETLTDLAYQLMQGAGGLLPKQKEEEEEEKYEERARDMAKTILDEYGIKLSRLLDEKTGFAFWKKEGPGMIHLQNVISEAIKGTWKHLIRDVGEKLFKEKDRLTELSAQMLTEAGASVFTAQKRWSMVTQQVGATGKGLDAHPMLTAKQVLEGLADVGFGAEEWKEMQGLAPKDWTKKFAEWRPKIQELLSNYIIGRGAQLPNILLWMIEEELRQQRRHPSERIGGTLIETPIWEKGGMGSKLPDIMAIVTEDAKDQFEEFLEANFDEKYAGELLEQMNTWMDRHGFWLAPTELKTIWTESKVFRETQTGREEVAMRLGGFGGAERAMTKTDLIKRLYPTDEIEKLLEESDEKQAKRIIGKMEDAIRVLQETFPEEMIKKMRDELDTYSKAFRGTP